ncbi:HET-C-related protein [Pseudomonas oryziphila]|nr:HET-C-related protein [Pseudomonas oryziphila]
MHEMNNATLHEEDAPVFESSFAHDQLSEFAMDTPELDFLLTFMPVFGLEVPAEVYLKLRTDILEGNLAIPAYQVVTQQDTITRYDNDLQVIFIDQTAIDRVLANPQDTPEFLLALLGAFGGHLANLIQIERHAMGEDDLSPETPEQAQQVAGRYASMMTFIDSSPENGTVFGYFTVAGEELTLALDVSDAPPVEAVIPELRRVGPQPRFAAGEDGHETIAQVLREVGFSAQEVQAVYFGNWLRDHSQLIDPKLVRPENAPKQFPRKISRDVLTQIVDLLALKAFNGLQNTEEGREAYRVTTELLGVYRPSEHIDNPTDHSEMPLDPREIDEDFEAPVRPGDHATRVYPYQSRKVYMDRPIINLHHHIQRAGYSDEKTDRLRHFGEALHIVEDYFAHSNFVELSLRKLGYEDVLPWTTETDCEHGLPVVTGLFSGFDILASVAEPLGKMMFPATPPAFEDIERGYRSDAEKVMLILLREQENPMWLQALERLLALRDNLADNPLFRFAHHAYWAVTLPLRVVGHYCNQVFQSLLTKLGDLVDDFQTEFGDDPNTTPGVDPTHSQLAKDHDTHPFHELAMLLAKEAVRQLGGHMQAYWRGELALPPSEEAIAFIQHPNDTDWQDEIVAEWASTHEQEIARGASSSLFDELRDNYEKHAREHLRELDENKNYTPIKTSESFRNLFPFF